MPMLSDIAGITGRYLEGTQAPYNQARKDALRASMQRDVDNQMLKAQILLNPDFAATPRDPEREAADILASAGSMFSAPQVTGAIGHQGQAQAQGAPMFSMAQPAPDLAQYDGLEKPRPAPVPAYDTPTGLALLTAPQDSLLAPQFRKESLAGADAASQVKGMLLGTPGAQGASAGGSQRSSGVTDSVAAELQNDYKARSKELSQLDRQDYLDKARLSLMKRKATQYIDQTRGLGGDDEWQAEVSRLEKSITDRDEQRTKTLQKLNDTDQKMIASRARSEAQNASIQLRRELNDELTRAKIDAMKAKTANDRMKILQDAVYRAQAIRMRKYEADTRAIGTNLPSDMINDIAAKKAYEQQALGQAISEMSNELQSLSLGMFAEDPQKMNEVIDRAIQKISGGMPSFAPQSPSTDFEARSAILGGGLTEDGAKQKQAVQGMIGPFDAWRLKNQPGAPLVPGAYSINGPTSERASVSASVPGAAKGDRTKKLSPEKPLKKLEF